MGAARHRFKQTTSLIDRLTLFAADARAKAERLPEGEARNQAIQHAIDAERAIGMENMLNSGNMASS
jgi:hypothetical protein